MGQAHPAIEEARDSFAWAHLLERTFEETHRRTRDGDQAGDCGWLDVFERPVTACGPPSGPRRLLLRQGLHGIGDKALRNVAAPPPPRRRCCSAAE
jgi:hypothetical protein